MQHTTPTQTERKCFSCGAVDVPVRKTEAGDSICHACDEYYAVGGPGELEGDWK